MTPDVDHPTESTPSPSTTSPTSSAPRAGAATSNDGGSSQATRLQSAVGFARRHRRLTIASVAGVALLSEPELALGVLLGAGTLALLNRRALRGVRAAAQGAAQAAGVSPEAAAGTGAEPEAQSEEGHPAEEPSARRRALARRAEALGHEVRERARAVAQAARGSLHPSPTDTGHEEPTVSPSPAPGPH